MFAHYNACILNRSKLGESLGVSYHTVDNYIGILTDTFMVRTLPPYIANLKKRLIKAPKFLFRDTGILHYLLGIKNFGELFAHPDYGTSFESFVIEQILSDSRITSGNVQAYFYRSHQGDEIDLLLDNQKELIAIEIKSSSAPLIPKGFYIAIRDLKIRKAFVIAPVRMPYPASENVLVCPIEEGMDRIAEAIG
jgi:predicted AAA+ superfamily ATPase